MLHTYIMKRNLIIVIFIMPLRVFAELSESEAIKSLVNEIKENQYHKIAVECLLPQNSVYKNKGYSVDLFDSCTNQSTTPYLISRWRIDSVTGNIFRQNKDGKYVKPKYTEKSIIEKEKPIQDKNNNAQLINALKSMNKKFDVIDDIVIYRHKSAPSFINEYSALTPYISIFQSFRTDLKLENTYVSDKWLFIKSYRVKVDDQIFDIKPNFITGEVQRDNGASGVWEWINENVNDEREAMLRAIASSKNAIIRYNGDQYIKDRMISENEKKIIGDVLNAYDALLSSKKSNNASLLR